MYLIAEKTVEQEGGTMVQQNKSQHRILDSKDGITYFASDTARALEDRKDFPRDDTLTHVNGIASAFNDKAG